MAETMQAREAIARAEMLWGAAHAFLYRAVEEFWAARDALTLNQHMIIARPAVETYGG